MNRAAEHIGERSTWSSYKKGWSSLLTNWRVVAVIYMVNLLIAFIAMGPLSAVVKKAIEKTTFHEGFSQGFDYTLMMDILNNYGIGINISFTLLASMAILVLLWAVFCSGGIMELSLHYPEQGSLASFWQGGGKYFFRYLRLSLYVFAVSAAFLFLLISILFSDGVNPFILESEAPLVRKVYILGFAFSVLMFFVGIFKELAKTKIAQDNSAIITFPNRAALAHTFQLSNILMGLLNLLVLILVFALYYLFRKLSGSYLIPALLVGQLFLVYRIVHRYVKQASFCYRNEAS